jgi:hypothetical protein
MSTIEVAFYMSDGSTGRSVFPHDGSTDSVDAIEALLREKKRAGKLLQVDSIDINSGSGSDIFIVPGHVIAVIVQKSLDLSGVA